MWYLISFITTLDLVYDEKTINKKIEKAKKLLDTIANEVIVKLKNKL